MMYANIFYAVAVGLLFVAIYCTNKNNDTLLEMINLLEKRIIEIERKLEISVNLGG